MKYLVTTAEFILHKLHSALGDRGVHFVGVCDIGRVAHRTANPALAGAEVRKDFEGFWRLLVARRAG
jgi:hypothetical protein